MQRLWETQKRSHSHSRSNSHLTARRSGHISFTELAEVAVAVPAAINPLYFVPSPMFNPILIHKMVRIFVWVWVIQLPKITSDDSVVCLLIRSHIMCAINHRVHKPWAHRVRKCCVSIDYYAVAVNVTRLFSYRVMYSHSNDVVHKTKAHQWLRLQLFSNSIAINHSPLAWWMTFLWHCFVTSARCMLSADGTA